MFLLLILPILVSGFVVCNTNPNYSYKLHRYEGQYLYLKSAHLGTISLVVFSTVALLLNKFVPASFSIFGFDVSLDVVSLVKSLLKDVVHMEGDAALTSFSWIVIVSIGAIINSYLWSAISLVRLRLKGGTLGHSKILLMYKVLSDSPLDKLFFESYLSSKPLMITLESRKVYVGTISSLGEPNESDGVDQEISIIPLISGYRCKDTLKVNFSTDYNVIGPCINIVIRQDQVLSASWFDFSTYEQLNSKQLLLPQGR